MKFPAEITRFENLLVAEKRGAVIRVDEPRDPKGEWWIDVKIENFQISIAYRESFGFGVFVESDGYGERPDEIYKDPMEVCFRVLMLEAFERLGRPSKVMWLKDLRKILGTAQTEIAQHLNKEQAAISRLENRTDVKLSTLAEYIEAIGGEMEIRVKFKSFEAPIAPPAATWLIGDN